MSVLIRALVGRPSERSSARDGREWRTKRRIPAGEQSTVDRRMQPSMDRPTGDDIDAAPDDTNGPAEPSESDDVILAIDIGGTKFAAGLVNVRGQLIARSRVDVERDVGPESHYSSLAALVREMAQQATDRRALLRAVGVGSAGPVTRQPY